VALNQIGGFWARAELPFRPVDMAFAPGNAGPSESDSDAAEGGRAVDQGARRPSQGPLAPEVGNRNFIASSGDDVVGMRSSGIHREDIPEHSRTTRGSPSSRKGLPAGSGDFADTADYEAAEAPSSR
jgi:hypothetical protein